MVCEGWEVVMCEGWELWCVKDGRSDLWEV